jgi:hypothetical protein
MTTKVIMDGARAWCIPYEDYNSGHDTVFLEPAE